VNGKVSYASQEAWTYAGTIKENILFDSEFDKEKYDEVIKVCALERDLTLFQDGDETFIGE
jgi:ATP-binding cassette subfamily C (CFTR/MRP) protein 4